MGFLLGLFGSKIFKYLGIPLLAAMIFAGGYCKGSLNANKKRDLKEAQEQIKRERNERKVLDKGRKIKQKVKDAKDNLSPADLDKFYSDQLSGDPFQR